MKVPKLDLSIRYKIPYIVHCTLYVDTKLRDFATLKMSRGNRCGHTKLDGV